MTITPLASAKPAARAADLPKLPLKRIALNFLFLLQILVNYFKRLVG
jgi:hypothetical protein